MQVTLRQQVTYEASQVYWVITKLVVFWWMVFAYRTRVATMLRDFFFYFLFLRKWGVRSCFNDHCWSISACHPVTGIFEWVLRSVWNAWPLTSHPHIRSAALMVMAFQSAFFVAPTQRCLTTKRTADCTTQCLFCVPKVNRCQQQQKRLWRPAGSFFFKSAVIKPHDQQSAVACVCGSQSVCVCICAHVCTCVMERILLALWQCVCSWFRSFYMCTSANMCLCFSLSAPCMCAYTARHVRGKALARTCGRGGHEPGRWNEKRRKSRSERRPRMG